MPSDELRDDPPLPDVYCWFTHTPEMFFINMYSPYIPKVLVDKPVHLRRVAGDATICGSGIMGGAILT